MISLFLKVMSPVLAAMKVTNCYDLMHNFFLLLMLIKLFLCVIPKVHPEYGLGTFRLSCGRHTTEEEVDRAADDLVRAIADHLKIS